ncbi:protein of unknown function [Methylocaldum szegediense]|uniref:Uncharacterized protein n=1 Tax=Methylocaldum szegediense TaxID=73780 RepID=A0ABM9HZ00_9GAMM|nr:protein of unknown function [Methylocaldum szegediense]
MRQALRQDCPEHCRRAQDRSEVTRWVTASRPNPPYKNECLIGSDLEFDRAQDTPIKGFLEPA